MKVLVAGGSGFIGSHLCDALLARGDEVLCMDNFVTGDKANIQHHRFAHAHPRFEFVSRDLVGELQTEPPLKNWLDVDVVAHLASPASPTDFERIPLEILHAGSTVTLNLLRLAKRIDAKFLLASTSEVYGDPEVHPQPESYRGNVSTTGVRACYDEGKRFSEAAASVYERSYGLEVRIARIFNTYGPRMRPDDGRVVTSFISSALNGDPLTIYGNGSQTRSFCYVDDLVGGLLALMDSDVRGPVNLGSDHEIEIATLAAVIASVTNTSTGIKYMPGSADDPQRRRPSLDRAKRLLGWQPGISLPEGLRRMVEAWPSRSTTVM